MPKRRCAHDRCPNLIPQGQRYCPTHAHQHEHKRGSATKRGYGAQHQRLRTQWATRIDAGATPTCPKCGKPITAADAWDLGHTADRAQWTGPEHRACNRADGGRRAGHPPR